MISPEGNKGEKKRETGSYHPDTHTDPILIHDPYEIGFSKKVGTCCSAFLELARRRDKRLTDLKVRDE